MTKTKIPTADEIYEILKSSEELAGLTDYLMRVGAGTVIEGLDTDPRRIWSWELADALAKPHDGEWETTIGRLVLAHDVDRMRQAAQQLHAKNSMCPYCRRTSQVRFRKRTQDYCCIHCKQTWTL